MILEKSGPQGLVCPHPGAIYMFITQPTIYRVIAYFSLYHELASDWSIVLDITWDYTMAWYPAQKIIYNGLVPISIDIRAIASFLYSPAGLNYTCPDWSIVLDITIPWPGTQLTRFYRISC